MSNLIKQENIYSLVWCLYYMQGVLYAEGSMISQCLLAVFFIMSMLYFVRVFQLRHVNRVIRALQVLAIMFGAYGIMRLSEDTRGWLYVNSATTYFKEYELSIMPVFAFYYFSRTGRINSQWFFNSSLLFFVTAIASYYYQEMQAMFRYDKDEVTNNAGYFIVSLLPVVAFLRKKVLYQYAALFVIFCLVVLAMKRGAIVVAVVGCSYFVWESFRKAKGKQKLLYILLGTAVVVAGVMYFRYQLETSDYMQIRLEQTKEGDMSARESMYPEYLSFFFRNSTVAEYMFGYGADGTLRNMGDYAHQDWIETLMNQGFFGVILMFCYWMALLYTCAESFCKRYTNVALILGLFIIIFFTKSMISMSINGMTIFSTSALAFALAAMDDPCIRKDLTDE